MSGVGGNLEEPAVRPPDTALACQIAYPLAFAQGGTQLAIFPTAYGGLAHPYRFPKLGLGHPEEAGSEMGDWVHGDDEYMRMRIKRQAGNASAHLPRDAISHNFSDVMDIAEKIRVIRKQLRLDQAGFAKRIGVSQSTVSRWENGQQYPEFDQLMKLASFFGENYMDFVFGSEHDVREDYVKVLGSVQAGAWRETYEWDESDQVNLVVPDDERLPNIYQFALLVKGQSMDLVFPENTILICVRYWDLGRQPHHGERVIVHRKDDRGLCEATVKELVVDADGTAWLVPKSSQPEFQQPIVIPDKSSASQESDVEVYALVVASLRPEPIHLEPIPDSV